MKAPDPIHERLVRDEVIKGSSDRGFGIVFAVLFAIIGLWPLLDGAAPRLWALAVMAVFLVVAWAKPELLAPLNRLWTRLALLLHGVVNPLVMGLMFYAFITPAAVIMRLRGKDLLYLRFDRTAESYWIPRRPPGPAPETMKNQF